MKSFKRHILLAAGLMAVSLSGFAEEDSAVTPVVVDELVPPYLEVQSSLADDNPAAARGEVEAFLSALDAAPQAESLDQLRDAAESLASSEDEKAARAAFLDISKGMIELVRTTGTSGEASLYVAHCPMAFSGEGASWLQGDTNVLNPYYGASMLRCGGIQEKIGG
ncbi:MAG: DUF3347 domain-containing protein [Oceanipulchritudo sp.]